VGRVGGAWRLIGSASLPATVDEDAVVHLLLRRLAAVDPDLTRRLGIHDVRPDALPAVTVRSAPARRLAVVAASERALAPLVAAAACSGWRTTSASAETMDPLEMSRLLLDGGVDGILAGAGDPPGADERGALAELTALVAAVAARRGDRLVILSGAMADAASASGELQARSGETLLAPAAKTGPAGTPLRALLAELALPADDARRALGHAAETLAVILDRRIELVDVGYDVGTRVIAAPGGPGEEPSVEMAVVPTAGLAPADPDDATVDRVLGWLTVVSDRHRLRDRMRELRIAPWADATGDGVALRMAAARAALGRLLDASPGAGGATAPDLMVIAGGVWATVAPPAAALAVADVMRRPGASAFALDHARLLSPLGSIPDPDERRAVFGDLVDDLLLPLGTIITPAGLHSGRSVGSLVLRGRADRGDHGPLELHPGGLEVVPLPPGVVATAEFKFRDAVRLGTKGRHFAVEVAGGLGGVLVDMRDVPLRLPERADRRRELLDGWQTSALRDGVARA
jgi:hypothetical protein